jgi:hypothetical protein
MEKPLTLLALAFVFSISLIGYAKSQLGTYHMNGAEFKQVGMAKYEADGTELYIPIYKRTK